MLIDKNTLIGQYINSDQSFNKKLSNTKTKTQIIKNSVKIPLILVNTDKPLNIKKIKDLLFIEGNEYNLVDLQVGDLIQIFNSVAGIEASILNDRILCNIPTYHILDFTNNKVVKYKIDSSPFEITSYILNDTIKSLTEEYKHYVLNQEGLEADYELINNNVYTQLNNTLFINQISTQFIIYFTNDLINTDDPNIINRGTFINAS